MTLFDLPGRLPSSPVPRAASAGPSPSGWPNMAPRSSSPHASRGLRRRRQSDQRQDPARAAPSRCRPTSRKEDLKRTGRARQSSISARSTCWSATPRPTPITVRMAGISDDQFRKILDNNIVANHWLIALVAPQMIARREGSIIIVSSIGGLKGSTMIGAYNDLESRRHAAGAQSRREFGPHNMRVNCIAPGLIRTDFAARAVGESGNLKTPRAHAAGADRRARRNRRRGRVSGLSREHIHDRPGGRHRRRRNHQLIG